MNAQELQKAQSEIQKLHATEISKASNILIGRWLKSPCSFKNKDYDRAAFSAYFNGSDATTSVAEKKYGMRIVINTISMAAARVLHERIQYEKAQRSPMN